MAGPVCGGARIARPERSRPAQRLGMTVKNGGY